MSTAAVKRGIVKCIVSVVVAVCVIAALLYQGNPSILSSSSNQLTDDSYHQTVHRQQNTKQNNMANNNHEQYHFDYLNPPWCRDLPPFPKYLSFLPNASLKHFEEWKMATQDRRVIYPPLEAVEEYMNNLTPYIICNPDPIKYTTPPKLSNNREYPTFETIDCSFIIDQKSNRSIFSEKREKPAFLIDMVSIGYELDYLEIRLNELRDAVDHFIIFESIYGHRKIHKPLFFTLTKHSRFAAYLDQIVHVILDDRMFYYRRQQDPEHDWDGESIMRWYPWKIYLQAINGLESLHNENILVISSDLDEIPNYESLLYLKFCKLNQGFNFPLRYKRFISYLFGFGDLTDIGGHPVIFKANQMSTEPEHSARRMAIPSRQRKLHDISDSTNIFYHIHMKNLYSSYVLSAKTFLVAEGGYFVELQRKYYDDPYEWHKPEKTRNWSIDTKLSEHVGYERMSGQPIPWFALCNKERFPWMFTKECHVKAPDIAPLLYECNFSGLLKPNCENHEISRIPPGNSYSKLLQTTGLWAPELRRKWRMVMNNLKIRHV